MMALLEAFHKVTKTEDGLKSRGKGKSAMSIQDALSPASSRLHDRQDWRHLYAEQADEAGDFIGQNDP